MERIKLFWKANNFTVEILKNYLKFSTKAEKFFDFFIPAVITAGILLFIFHMTPSTSDVLKGVKDINNQTLTFISILAGFNIACIPVLAVSGSKLTQKLKDTPSKRDNKISLFEVMLTFFSATIVFQFIIILLGIIILVVSSIIDFPGNFKINYFHWSMICIWVYLLILTVFVSIRNLKTLFVIVINEDY